MFTLHNGDCLQVMPSIPSGSIDAIITDLPYGTTACKWDTVIEFAPMWKEVKRVLKPSGVFITTASQPFTSALIMSNPVFFQCEWIWRKDKPSNFALANRHPMKYHENIIVFANGKNTYNKQISEGHKPMNGQARYGRTYHGSVPALEVVKRYSGGKTSRNPSSVIEVNTVKHNSPDKGGLHPTQKPVALYEYLIKTYTNEGETILDIAMGSGTTIEAAEQTGRNSIGIEKDEGIFQSAVLRLKPFTPSNKACSGRVDSSGSLELFPAEVSPSAKVTRQTTRR